MFKLDEFQKKAIRHIESGESVIIAAPTGSGKTLIAEKVIDECRENGTHVIYTAPVKALSNQKYRDFSLKYPDDVGILTGDVSINPQAPILIMTTEIFRNKLLEKRSTMQKYSWVIFDEIHYLDDPQRGTVWEESIMFLPAHMKLLCLSATIPNLKEFVDWIEQVHGMKVKIVEEKKRAVPLHFFYQCGNKIYPKISQLSKVYEKCIVSYKARKGRSNRVSYDTVNIRPNKLSALVDYILQNDELPCLYFSFGRRRCEELASDMRAYSFVTKDEKKQIKVLYDELLAKYDIAESLIPPDLHDLIRRGVAYHHAGMLPTIKEIVERLFTSRLIKIIFTTETFALGINMPAKTVIFDELRKFYGLRFENLKTRDFYQMAGRAGRRSLDEYGIVITRVNPRFIRQEEVKNVIQGRQERVYSQFNSGYATLLHLYQIHKDSIEKLYPRTFHYYQSNPFMRDKALSHFIRKIELLKSMGYIKDKKLTLKGQFASEMYGYELIMGELFSQGVFDDLNEIDINTLLCAIVYEPRKKVQSCVLSKNAKRLLGVVEQFSKPINRIEKLMNIKPFSKKPSFGISAAIEAYSNNKSFETILEYVGEDEGEIVRSFRMVIQLQREIIHSNIASSQIKSKMRNSMHRINRGVIDAEKQLNIK